MADGDRDDENSGSRAVISGLVALVAVALSVGLVLGGVALGATSFLGLGDDDGGGNGGKAQQSLYLPKPQKTETPSPTAPTTGDSGTTESSPTESESDDEPEISLQAAQTEVGSFDPIDLSGVYTGGEGAILRVQRFENGKWADFDVTIPVSDETFSTYVQTSVTGMNRWRVIDTDTGTTSNEVRVDVKG